MNKKKQQLDFGRQFYLMKMIVLRASRRTSDILDFISAILMVLSAIASMVCLVCLVIYVGYDHSLKEFITLKHILRAVQIIFLTNIGFNLIFKFTTTIKSTKLVKWIVDVAVLVTALPLLYPHPDNPWIPWLEQLLYSNKFLYGILAAYSVVSLSYSLFRLLSRRTNPSLLLSGSFIVFILIGSFLLMLPKCTYHDISYVDSLFVSTSAVSINGLCCVDVPSTFTPMGILILALLIQIGALGVMTFTSFFALFFSGSTSIYNQLMLKDMVYSKNMNSLIPTILYIMVFTMVIEFFGAIFIFLTIHGTLDMSVPQELAFSAFHSLSAFCNAGFSTLPDGMSNPMLLGGNIPVYWVLTLLIIAGSLGFPILVNFRDAVVIRFKNFRNRLNKKSDSGYVSPIHVYNMNTKIVIVTYLSIFVISTILFFIFEYSNSLAGMTLLEKITQSVFNSATPRSAGFMSVNPSGFLNITLVMVLFLMWVGGASQSTGGGIKVNTFAAIWLNLRAVLTGAPRVTAFRRTISLGSIRRANAVVAISIISYLLFSMFLLGLEPELSSRDLLFEMNSALFSVGSSLGVTPRLSDYSKILVSIAMFVGRVGLISLLTGLVRHHRAVGVEYPSDNIIIN